MMPSSREPAQDVSCRVGVLGAGGQVGRCLVRAIQADPKLALDFAEPHEALDVASFDRVEAWLDDRAERDGGLADVVVNAAGHTRVDACEQERSLAFRVNGEAPGVWAAALARRGRRLLHLSTDYVFSGRGRRPYREDDPPDPQTVYGASKRAGEEAVLSADPTALVVRTSWVFGPGRNFVVAILDQVRRRRVGEVRGPLRVVDDQRGSPTSAADLAQALCSLAVRLAAGEAEVSGLLHVTNAGDTTWYGLASVLLELVGEDGVALEPIPTSAYPTPAPRPAYSVLDIRRAAALGIGLRPWRDALAGYLSGPDRPAMAGAGPVVHTGTPADAIPTRPDSAASEIQR